MAYAALSVFLWGIAFGYFISTGAITILTICLVGIAATWRPVLDDEGRPRRGWRWAASKPAIERTAEARADRAAERMPPDRPRSKSLRTPDLPDAPDDFDAGKFFGGK